jgi:hypothetical protein
MEELALGLLGSNLRYMQTKVSAKQQTTSAIHLQAPLMTTFVQPGQPRPVQVLLLYVPIPQVALQARFDSRTDPARSIAPLTQMTRSATDFRLKVLYLPRYVLAGAHIQGNLPPFVLTSDALAIGDLKREQHAPRKLHKPVIRPNSIACHKVRLMALSMEQRFALHPALQVRLQSLPISPIRLRTQVQVVITPRPRRTRPIRLTITAR